MLSIVTPTLNNQKLIKHFLKSIKRQKFPRNELEVIIVDGGSKDKTLAIAKKYRAKIIRNPHVFADIGVNLGIQQAKGELIMVLATDNIFKSNTALKKMVAAFSDKRIYAAFPKQVSGNNDTIYTKYINTFTDPVNHFVYGYASNPRTFHKIYKTIEKNPDYILFDYKSNSLIPMIAFAQGFTVRSGFKRSRENAFDDTTPVIELIEKNKKIAYVYSVDLYHHTINGLWHFIDKQAWRTRNYLKKKNFGISHRIKLLSFEQTERIKFWPIYSLTIIPSVIYATYHLLKDRDKMWIFHPLLCTISAYTSLIATLAHLASQTIKKNEV